MRKLLMLLLDDESFKSKSYKKGNNPVFQAHGQGYFKLSF